MPLTQKTQESGTENQNHFLVDLGYTSISMSYAFKTAHGGVKFFITKTKALLCGG